jgi:hypothetical protein
VDFEIIFMDDSDEHVKKAGADSLSMMSTLVAVEALTLVVV